MNAITRRTSRTIRYTAAATLGLTLSGLTVGALSAPAIPLPLPLPTLVPLTIPPITIGPLPTLATIPPFVTIVPLDVALLSMNVALTAPAGPVERGSNYAYSMKIKMGDLINGPVTVLHSVPPTVSGAVWSCSTTGGATCGGGAAGAGNISRNLTMPGGSTVTFLVNGTITDTATNFAVGMSAVRAGTPVNRSVDVAVNVPAAPTTVPPAPTTTAPAPVPTVPPALPTVPPAPTTPPAPTPVPTPAAPAVPATNSAGQPIVIVLQQPAPQATKKVVKKAKKKIVKKAKKSTRRTAAVKKAA